MSKPLLQYPDIRAPHLEGHYYTYVRKYCAKHNISLEVNGIEIQQPPRENNKCIMDVACSDIEIRKDDCKLNYYCKCYLQVKWISDLLTADAKIVPTNIYKGIRSITQSSSSKLEEVVQERPNEKSWATWRKFLKKHVCNKQKKATVNL